MASGKYRVVSDKACKKLVLGNHYSGRMPASIKLCYALMSPGNPPNRVVACCIFSTPVGRWEAQGIWELTRLVREDSVVEPLTRLISKAVKHIRASGGAWLLISFADREEDHHGGIYQASSWIYSGSTKNRLDGFNIDGLFVPARTCNARYGTSSVKLLRLRLPQSTINPHFDQGKYIYWKPLDKKGVVTAVRMGLRSLPYPKPMIDSGVSNMVREGSKGRIDLTAVTTMGGDRSHKTKKLTLGRNVAHKKTRP